VKEFSAINFIDISPVQPYDALVTSSGKVGIKCVDINIPIFDK